MPLSLIGLDSKACVMKRSLTDEEDHRPGQLFHHLTFNFLSKLIIICIADAAVLLFPL